MTRDRRQASLPALRTLTVYSARGQDYLLRRAPWFAQLETFETDSEPDDAEADE